MSAAPKAQAAPGEGGARAAADAAPSGPAHESSAGGGWLRSLRARLLAGALAWIALALALAGWGLRNLFQEHITAQWQAQLAVQLDQLSAAVNLSPGGSITLAPEPGDPRLSRPLSGVYWQIDRLQARGDGAFAVTQPAAARSRSLWDQTLPLPATATAARRWRSRCSGRSARCSCTATAAASPAAASRLRPSRAIRACRARFRVCIGKSTGSRPVAMALSP